MNYQKSWNIIVSTCTCIRSDSMCLSIFHRSDCIWNTTCSVAKWKILTHVQCAKNVLSDWWIFPSADRSRRPYPTLLPSASGGGEREVRRNQQSLPGSPCSPRRPRATLDLCARKAAQGSFCWSGIYGFFSIPQKTVGQELNVDWGGSRLIFSGSLQRCSRNELLMWFWFLV